MPNNGLHFGRDTEDELSARKSASMRELASHREHIRKEYPEIEALRREIDEIGIEFAEKIIASPNDSDALDELAKHILSDKNAELKRLLVSSVLPEDYLELRPICPVCRDTGVVDGEMCRCLKKVIVEKRFPGSGLDPEQSFENFRHDLISDPNMKRAQDRICAYCEEYADSFPDNELPDMLLMGAPGIGKTYLLNCIGGRVLNNGFSVLRLTANRLVSNTLDSIRSGEPAPDLVMPDLLIIDDLGAEPMINNVTVETLLTVICERQDAKKATLIASNKATETLAEEYGDRIFSRMIAPNRVKAIRMNTPSIRIMKI